MLSYSLRANATLRTHVKGGAAFERSDPRPGQSAVVVTMDALPRSGEEDKARCEVAVPTLAGSDRAAALDRGVNIFPSSAIDRRAISWNGGKAELIQVTSRDRTEFSFLAPFHLLIAYEQGTRRDGQTYVEGLPASKLREVRRRLTFVPAGHEYREWHESCAPGRIAYLYFDPANLLSASETNALAVPFAPLLFVEDLMVWEWAMKAAAMIESGSANPRYCEALGTMLAHEIVRLNAEARRSNLPLRGGLAAWQQRIVTTYIEEHLAEPISLTELAQVVRLSVYHFCRSFKKSFGVPPHRYHNIRRIERAKCLLAKPGCSVTEIGLTVGFSETSSFTAAFRRMTGSTPTSYRRSIE
jgi:AraC family transcriptional regulator